MLVTIVDALSGDSPASPVSMTLATSTQLLGLDAGLASTDGVSPSVEHNGVQVSSDSANSAAVYLLLGGGVASANNWHVCLAAGGSWPGTIGGVVWRGAVQGFSTAAAKVGVVVA